MNKHLIVSGLYLFMLFTPFFCKAVPGVNNHPASVVQAVFNAAKSGNFSALSGLCDPANKGDGDTKMLCSMSEQRAEVKREFRQHFSKGRIIGKALIKGDEATVKIKFGPDGKQDEEFRLRRIEGKWYLISY